jgi:hypothetical protein
MHHFLHNSQVCLFHKHSKDRIANRTPAGTFVPSEGRLEASENFRIFISNIFEKKTVSIRMSHGISGSIVSDYGLDDRANEVRSPTGDEDFSSSPCVQNSSGAHPASYPMGTRGPFPGGKVRPGRDADHSPPSNAEVKYE